MQSFGLHYLPITFSLLVIITFIISYAMSAAFGDVSILFPYISDLGTLAPESCVFGQLLNLCSFLGCLCIYCWYGHQIERLENMGSPRSHFIFARVTLAFGLTAGLGLSVVGNFQETSVLTVHLIGALMTFGFGTLYTIMVSHTSRAHLDSPKWLRTLRVSLAVTCSVAFVAMFLFAGLTRKGINLPHKWEPGEKVITLIFRKIMYISACMLHAPWPNPCRISVTILCYLNDSCVLTLWFLVITSIYWVAYFDFFT
ncbi:DNA damage-regulated autophagy modulator protein 2 [Paragonimus westermani]|uniref:DNA damage-regulated autophagy modulator protein 2 n=1 Tax=Paragonimus westermani TaxID=34504 RepID=A0A5J4NJU9_9TREM|nr:DNA damage-regulated autophagy modulator protein 2 [Paragonimus westermani]